MAGEGRSEQRLGRAPGRIDPLARDLVERLLANALDLGLLEARVRDGVREHVEADLEERRGDHRVVHGLVEPGPGAESPLDLVELARGGAGRAPLGAPIDEVLEEVRRARQRRGIVGGAGRHPDLNRDHRRDVVLLDQDPDAVVELGLDPRVSPPIAKLPRSPRSPRLPGSRGESPGRRLPEGPAATSEDCGRRARATARQRRTTRISRTVGGYQMNRTGPVA